MRQLALILLLYTLAPSIRGQDNSSMKKSGTISVVRAITEPDSFDRLFTDKQPPSEDNWNARILVTSTVQPDDKINQAPVFQGGGLTFERYFGKYISYPTRALDSNISGVVSVTFLVNTDGYVREPKITRGIGGGCDKEVLRLLNRFPKWIPAKGKWGAPVSSSVDVEVKFEIK